MEVWQGVLCLVISSSAYSCSAIAADDDTGVVQAAEWGEVEKVRFLLTKAS